MYIWIEGQDVDCYGLPDDTELIANIQFRADYSNQSGLVDIEDEEESAEDTEQATEEEPSDEE
jgi:hypothetical protein